MQCRSRIDKFFKIILVVAGIIYLQLLVISIIDKAGYLDRSIYDVIAFFSLTCMIVAVCGKMIGDVVCDIVCRLRS